MPSSSIIWGLVNNVQFEGGIVDNTSTMAVNTGWNPALGLIKQSLPRSASSGCTDLQQLEMGWRYTVVVAGGQAYVCETKDLQCISSGGGSTGDVASSAPSWRLLELPINPQLLNQPMSSAAPLAQQLQVTQVAAGDEHCLLLTAAGSVWALGSNQYGQVGCSVTAPGDDSSHGDDHHCQPSHHYQQQQQHAAGQDALKEHPGQQSGRTAVAAAAGHAAASGWQAEQPVLVMGPGAAGAVSQAAVTHVAAGACHSAAVTAARGQLFCWGWNAHGQCCTGTTSDVLQPQLCSALDGVPLSTVAAGMAHTVCVSRDGAVYACGWNSNGQLGTIRAAAVAAKDGGTAVSTAAGSRLSGKASSRQQEPQGREFVGMSSLQPQLVEGPELDQEQIVQVACGSRHTVVLTATGSVFAWGWNKYSQCGVASIIAQNVLQPTRVWTPRQPDVRALELHTGRWHTCVVGEIQPVQPV